MHVNRKPSKRMVKGAARLREHARVEADCRECGDPTTQRISCACGTKMVICPGCDTHPNDVVDCDDCAHGRRVAGGWLKDVAEDVKEKAKNSSAFGPGDSSES
jgi:hypothetical protein